MQVVDVPGYDTNVLIGPTQGASRLCLWGVAEPAGFAITPHHHHGEEVFRVLYGRLRFTVGEVTQEIRAGHVVIVPPGATHSHEVLADAEIEIFGEIGAGIFVWETQPDGSVVETELFVPGVPWSRTPPDGASARDGRPQLYRTVQESPVEKVVDPRPPM